MLFLRWEKKCFFLFSLGQFSVMVSVTMTGPVNAVVARMLISTRRMEQISPGITYLASYLLDFPNIFRPKTFDLNIVHQRRVLPVLPGLRLNKERLS